MRDVTGRLQTSILTSVDELLAVDGEWDDLWCRSETTAPVARAALVAQWVRQFAPEAQFRAILVRDERQLLAGLPLVATRRRGTLAVARLAQNPWVPGTDLLVDANCDPRLVAGRLIDAWNQLPWPLLWFDFVPLATPRWEAICEVLSERGLTYESREQFAVGDIDLTGEWPTQQAGWSRNHRKKLTRSLRQLQQQGQLRLRLESRLAPDEVEPWLRKGWELEDRGWKGRAGTSVLKTPGMVEMLARQARQLAAWGQLELAFLELDDQLLAFEMGWNAKRVYHSYKVAYNEQFASYSPGHLLMYFLLEQFHLTSTDPCCRRLRMDCLGPISDAVSKWNPRPRSTGRLLVANGTLGRLLLRGYQLAAPAVRRLTGRQGIDVTTGTAGTEPRDAEHPVLAS